EDRQRPAARRPVRVPCSRRGARSSGLSAPSGCVTSLVERAAGRPDEGRPAADPLGCTDTMPILISLVLGLVMLQAPPAQRFTSSSELVVLHVTVLDHKSGFVSGLAR